MKKEKTFLTILDGTRIAYRIRKSHRAKNIRMTFVDEDSLVVTLPYQYRVKNAERALFEHKNWILRKLKESQTKKKIPSPFQLTDGALMPVLDKAFPLSLKVSNNQKKARWDFQNKTLNVTVPQLTPSVISRGVVHWYRTMALLFLEDRVPFWAEKINVSPNHIRAKNQHTLWGSCSKRANLNFNWRILLLSIQAADYLIIHELSHLKEMNHSPKFWKLVREYCPEYKTHKAELREKNAWLKFPSNEANHV
ncbi:M48 family metallopeptidase [Acidobacteriota bacterium]